MPIKHRFEGNPTPVRRRRAFWDFRRKIHGKSLLFWSALTGAGVVLAGMLMMTIAFAWYSRDLPDPNALMERNVPQSTKIFDKTGKILLYEIHGDENRTLLKVEDIPDSIKWATVAVEDKHFYSHHGIDWAGLLRAFVKNTLQGKRIGGTSTLTQQFVKNAILTNERSIERKLKEVVLALQIERLYTKDQILQLYLNEIPYGSTMYGIESAAIGYFGKSAKELTLDESALLAALPQAPDLYSPYGTGSRGDNRERLIGRQKYIIDLMVEQGFVTKEKADEAKTVDTLKKLVPKKVGDIKAPHFVTYVRSLLVEKYGQRLVEQGGLRVTTSLDWDLQQVAEEEVKRGVDERGEAYKFTNAALVAIETKTGHIVSMVGSKDFFDQEHDGQVNVTLRPRQPGSSFKPIVYAAGFLKGYTPEMTLWDVNTVFKTDIKNYEPKNYDLKEHGPVSARMALQGSLNIPAVKMLYLVGVGRVLDFAEKLGYTTLGDRSRFGLSLVLGGGEVKLLEHVNAYAVFADEGKLVPNVAILKVEDDKGAALEEWKPADGQEVMDKNAALLISNVLSDNGARSYIFGANNALTLPGRAVAAKTGTTNNYHDAWTVGYTPSLAAGVWVGNNDNAEMKRGADGSVIAAPIWQAFMKRATKGTPAENFSPPAPNDSTKPILLGKANETAIKIDKISGKLATEFTPPELVEEKIFHDAHSELWYLDKDDPRGPAPTDPNRDPQFQNWENAVKLWVEKEQWNTTSTPPTESDDLHTQGSTPQISLVVPQANDTWTMRTPTISVSVSAQRLITRIEATMDGVAIGSGLNGNLSFTARVPNSIEIGFHDLTVTAYDDVGNRGSATISINLTADKLPQDANISSPANGSTLTSSMFPYTMSVGISDSTTVNKIDVYIQNLQTGNSRLLYSDVSPQKTALEFLWNEKPISGTYSLYVVIIDKDNQPTPGGRVTITVE
jgi:penicillin-binding protein 1C